MYETTGGVTPRISINVLLENYFPVVFLFYFFHLPMQKIIFLMEKFLYDFLPFSMLGGPVCTVV